MTSLKLVEPMKKCFLKECEVEIEEDLLMCNEHWLRVPRDLRLKIWAAEHSANWRLWKILTAQACESVRERVRTV